MLRSLLIGSCGATAAHLSSHLEGDLRGLRRIRVVSHLARCERCRAVYESLRATVRALGALGVADPRPAASLAEAVAARIRSDRDAGEAD